MKLYVNGDSHTAAAEAVNAHAFAEDDGRYFYMGRAPHPDNLAVSWGKRLSQTLKAAFYCDAESASSNARIMRTTRHWLETAKPHPEETLIIIQWTTWEREEWQIEDGTYIQVNASGIDDVPESMQLRYKNYVIDVNWDSCTRDWHDKIYEFHLELEQQGYRHIFFNGNNHFAAIPEEQRKDWGTSYIDPYDLTATYDVWLKRNGHTTVSPDSWHFGSGAHAQWARFMLKYIMNNQLLD